MKKERKKTYLFDAENVIYNKNIYIFLFINYLFLDSLTVLLIIC